MHASLLKTQINLQNQILYIHCKSPSKPEIFLIIHLNLLISFQFSVTSFCCKFVVTFGVVVLPDDDLVGSRGQGWQIICWRGWPWGWRGLVWGMNHFPVHNHLLFII